MEVKIIDNAEARPAQIPIMDSRYHYLTAWYRPGGSDDWVMHHQPCAPMEEYKSEVCHMTDKDVGHFLLSYKGNCLYDAVYVRQNQMRKSEKDDPLAAVIVEVRICQDEELWPKGKKDEGFFTLAKLIDKEL